MGVRSKIKNFLRKFKRRRKTEPIYFPTRSLEEIETELERTGIVDIAEWSRAMLKEELEEELKEACVLYPRGHMKGPGPMMLTEIDVDSQQ